MPNTQNICQFDNLHNPNKAVDGDKTNVESNWVPTANKVEVGDYWQVDLGRNERLYKINVYSWAGNYHDLYSKFHIEISKDGAKWTKVAQENNWDDSRVDGQSVSYTFNPVDGRYVRIVSDVNQNFVRLQEVEVFRVLP